ncbi:helix-turn-helix domain-containing protein [Mycolicibacterium sphagni]|uniref:HTH cro/C1-type domain-containing protein n=1 Tax=Mycolicibacterium sphagni TaxID=1786 RepID=A0A255DJR3_9MYCO|nr:helix-turn-helix transcriptional regulator [Mycolicibacterium sphagni]OYN78891.1 hypothetical protein CG716_13555 [Mycolicibacterium sphagni]
MVGKEPDVGTTAQTVAANVNRLRVAQNMNYSQLSERLKAATDWSINAVGIRRIESGERRVTPDDLVALAIALKVSPAKLLMPPATERSESVEVTGVNQPVQAEELWAWLTSDQPLRAMQIGPGAFRDNTWPQWLLDEFESLVDDVRRQTVKSLGDD